MFLFSELSSCIWLTFQRDVNSCLHSHFEGTEGLFSECFQLFVMIFAYRSVMQYAVGQKLKLEYTKFTSVSYSQTLTNMDLLADLKLTSVPTISHKIPETFLCFSIVSVQHKWNWPRFLSPKVECSSCLMICQTT